MEMLKCPLGVVAGLWPAPSLHTKYGHTGPGGFKSPLSFANKNIARIMSPK